MGWAGVLWEVGGEIDVLGFLGFGWMGWWLGLILGVFERMVGLDLGLRDDVMGKWDL